LKLIEKRNNGTEPSINPFGRNVSCHFCLPRANGVRPAPRGLTAYITAHAASPSSSSSRLPPSCIPEYIYQRVCTRYPCYYLYTYTALVVVGTLHVFIIPAFYYYCNYYTYTSPPPFTLLIPATRRRPRKTVPITAVRIIIIYFESQFVFGLVSI